MKHENINNSSDDVIKKKVDNTLDFAFDRKVTLVFDDMVSRSVPFYAEIQQMVSELVKTMCSHRQKHMI